MPLSPARQSGLSPAPFSHPFGLAVQMSQARDESDDLVVCVHGTLDRGGSFARLARRLETSHVVAYDRRGYQGSRSVGASAELSVHVEDVLATIEAAQPTGAVTLVGHSFGGVIAIAAALKAPGMMSAVVAYEPPLPWLLPGGHPFRGVPLDQDPAIEVERFFRRMVSDASWERLHDSERQDRIDDGPAMIGDLTIVRMEVPFTLDDLSRLAPHLTIGVGTSTVMTHHLESARTVVASVPSGNLMTIDGAGHGAHLSHPDHLATLVRDAGTHG